MTGWFAEGRDIANIGGGDMANIAIDCLLWRGGSWFVCFWGNEWWW